MGLIAFLILLGAFFLVAELVFLPGLTFGLVLSLAGYGAAIYLGFVRLGFVGGIVTVVVVVALSLLLTILSLRAKTWQRLALNDKVEGQSTQTPSNSVKVGDKGYCISRLSPMGKVSINGEVYEAKSVDSYVDQRSNVEVVGFENFTVIVKRID
ncbi:MAG: NfeD family protein [Alistipes sp.]|nr:NfeD family protein [Alistipes sp.]